MENFHDFQQAYGGQIETIVGAMLVLFVGWIIALLAGAGVRKLLSRLSVNQRLSTSTGHIQDVEHIAARIVFWFILIIAIVASLNILNLYAVSTPFSNMINKVLLFIPSIFSALAIGVLGWILAITVRSGLTRLFARTSLDEKLSAEVGVQPLSNNIGQIAYFLILLLFLPLVLAELGLIGLLAPVQNLVNDLLLFIPNIFAAAVIGIVGYFVAVIVRGIVVGFVAGINLQSTAERIGVKQATSLPHLAGTIVFLLILLPTFIAALDALNIQAISLPAINMLNQILYAIPHVVAAALILIITYVVVKFVSAIIVSLIAGTGADEVPARLDLQRFLGNTRLSQLVGYLVIFFAMLFAVTEASNRLGFHQVSDLVTIFITFGANVLLGVAIFVIGFWLANLVGSIVQRGNYGCATWLANLVRVLIIGLVIAMGLRAMGIADSIVNLAFGLTLGSVAVAFALAFGLGGREPAAKLLDNLIDTAKDKSSPSPVAPVVPPATTDDFHDPSI